MSRRRRDSRAQPSEESGDEKIASSERLQKVLAAAGLGSRRDCEELITEGRVEVDRHVVTELGTKVDPLKQEIRVDGVALHRPKRLYFAVNKPPGVITTNFDPSGRARVIDLVPTQERVFAVGRLDRASEGLILVTNDGDLANKVTHPRYGLEKTYHVRVEGAPSNEQLLRLRRGVYIAEGLARVQSVKVKSRHKNVSDLEIVLNEGKNREIRRILAKIGHKVLTLKRISVGPVKLGELKTGAARKLMPQEIEALLEATRERRKAGKRKRTAEARGDKVPAQIERMPEPAATPGNAPPKIDLATLLNPHLAPKRAMAVTEPVIEVPAGPPPIGDVIVYETNEAASLTPAARPAKKRRRPVREYETDSAPIQSLDAPAKPAGRGARRAPPAGRRESPSDRRFGKPASVKGRGGPKSSRPAKGKFKKRRGR
jgi:23S rRNA pseudouridine2605 synthase